MTDSPLTLLRRHYLHCLPSRLRNWHEFWLYRCLELALQGLGRVAPNPLVGAVLVRPRGRPLARFLSEEGEQGQGQGPEPQPGQTTASGGESYSRLEADCARYFEVLGQGYHAACGQLHAEAAAFADAARNGYGPKDFQEAILYCNLEPCSFRAASKKQPPCCEQVVQRRVGAVIFANIDPNPEVAGRGASELRRAGLIVRSGDFALPSASVNQIFFRHITGGRGRKAADNVLNAPRPWVSLKLAQSLDACIATKSGDSRWISGPKARAMVQALRAGHSAKYSAVTVGCSTLEADDPSLLLRPAFLQELSHSGEIALSPENQKRLACRQPWRVVWDSQLRSSSLPLQFYSGPERERSIAIYHRDNPEGAERAKVLQQKGIAAIGLEVPLHSTEGLARGLAELSRPPYNIQHLLLEGGAQLAGSFLAAGLVDEVYCFISQRFIGAGLRSLQDIHPGQERVLLSESLQLRHNSSMRIVEDRDGWDGPEEVLCHGYPNEIFIPQTQI
ncbi:dihydrofolate reductase family protein [Candidatus Haliotispira prima]|uniref:Riboflavin biosynthesis protein RibD n=1 Tax=Candidatus Haliotispira prima TaxID=3034016 RepID=A0ABY8ME61_9SPIO|nr:dihydrofolate reductase family protein [Candidatus Haliotispira prima]